MAPPPLLEQAFSSPTPTLLFLSLVSFLFFIFLFLRKPSRSRHLRHPPPSPPTLPILGNLHQLGTLAHRSLQQLSFKYGPIMLIHLGQVPTLVVSNARMARHVLKTHDALFASRPLLKVANILAYNHHDLAFAPYGEQWRSLRKIANLHLLSSKRVVHTFKHLREEEVAFMVDKIEKEVAASPHGTVNMRDAFYKFTNDIICHMMTGKSFRKDGREEKLMKIVVDSIPLLGKFNPEDFFPSLKWLGRLIGAKVREEARQMFLMGDAMMTEVLNDRLQGRTDGGDEDFLDTLLKLQKDEKQKKEFELKDEHVKALCYVSS